MKKLEKYLPRYILMQLQGITDINEIRLKRDSKLVIKRDGKNYIIDLYITSDEFDSIMDRLLEYSYHSKLPQVIEGYISLGDGYRAGIAGHAVVNNGAVTNLSEIDSVCIRLPFLVRGVCGPVITILEKSNFNAGILIFSPPGGGKTTLLRDLIIRLCDTPIYKRIALIDTRTEIYLPVMSRYPMLDVYSGYPKNKGIEQAIRTMSPDMIVCDEIGNDMETEAILANQSAGVPIIATAHGSDYYSIIKRDNITKMHTAGVFTYYIGISRKPDSNKFNFKITENTHVI